MPIVLPQQVTTTVTSVPTDSGSLRVARLEPPGAPTRTFIVAMGYAAWIDEFELQRFRLMASELQARLLVVETPGLGLPASRLRRQARLALLRRADLQPVASRMLDAAEAASPTPLDQNVGVMGYSLGATLATAVSQELLRRRGAPTPALVLVEPVTGLPWRALALRNAVRLEDSLVDDALKQNAEISGAVEPWDRTPGANAPRHNRLDLVLLANALRRGNLAEQVIASQAGRVVIVTGKNSRLALPAAIDHLLLALKTADIDVRHLQMDGTHGLWHSLPSVQTLTQFARDALVA